MFEQMKKEHVVFFRSFYLYHLPRRHSVFTTMMTNKTKNDNHLLTMQKRRRKNKGKTLTKTTTGFTIQILCCFYHRLAMTSSKVNLATAKYFHVIMQS